MNRKQVVVAAVAAALLAGIGGAVYAQDAASQVNARRTFMKGLGAQMKLVREGDLTAARNVAAGFKAFKTQFPAGSDASAAPTRATAAVWSSNADFMAKVDSAIDAADRAARSDGDAAAMTAAAAGIDCMSCHTTYRGPAV